MIKPLAWLLELDPVNPGVRYFALRDLLDRPPADREVQQAQAAVMATGPVPQILATQAANGSWGTPVAQSCGDMSVSPSGEVGFWANGRFLRLGFTGN